MRYARPEFLNAIAKDTSLPMIVDAELGMPLDLGQWECLWEEDADDLGTPYASPSLFALDLHICIEADLENLPKLDQNDAFILGDPSSSSAPYTNPRAMAAQDRIYQQGRCPALPSCSGNVCTFNYSTHVDFKPACRKLSIAPTIDVSRDAQLRDEASFAACNDSFDLSTLHHPAKSDVTAVESYEVLPDAEIWANQ